MREAACVAVEGRALGDLSGLEPTREGLKTLGSLLGRCGGLSPREGKVREQLFDFVLKPREDDRVIVMRGRRVLGVGRVEGPYFFEPASEFAHRHRVRWLSLEEFSLPGESPVTERTLLRELDALESILAVEAHLERVRAPTPEARPRPSRGGARGHVLPALPGLAGRVQEGLERKGQLLLYGPPGTGKTFLAERTARELAAHAAFGRPFEALGPAQREAVLRGSDTEGPLVRVCCFHPSYGYEDFIEGYRPVADGPREGPPRFALRDGLFKRLCLEARRRPHQRFYLVIDEFNRGDVPRILGELLTVLEPGKRGREVLLPLSGAPFLVPENVYLLGTMNTADRSIALLDAALRRRFAFLELMPEPELLGEAEVEGLALGPWLRALNQRILAHVGRDGRNLQVGHAYLLERERPLGDFPRFARVVQEELVPLLEEYCYEDWGALEKLLGDVLVDREARRVRHELFAPEHQAALRDALGALGPP
ncbi:AAA family ATPase [Archangium primigenium]|nr:AAA family ATPase [Archangium primigenium]